MRFSWDSSGSLYKSSRNDRRLFWVSSPPFGSVISSQGLLMVGKPGCSGGRRAGAGRKPGTTAIKKTGKATTKKKKVTDLDPSSASVTFLDAFVVKKKAAAAEAAAAESVRSSLEPGPYR